MPHQLSARVKSAAVFVKANGELLSQAARHGHAKVLSSSRPASAKAGETDAEGPLFGATSTPTPNSATVGSGQVPGPSFGATSTPLPNPAAGTATPPSAARPAPRSAGAAGSATHGWGAVPSMARTLGLAGALPFVALSPPIAALLPLPLDLLGNAGVLQVAYGASIASFLGGIHWALAMAEYGGPGASAKAASTRYLWSVTPCLMAWPAVVMPSGPASLAVGSVLGVAYAVDRSFAAQGLLPHWYMTLRLPLTLLAVGGLGTTLFASLLVGDISDVPTSVAAEATVLYRENK